MSNTVISVENVSKQYRLGVIGTGTFRNDLKLWWAKARNKPNPLALVSEVDHGNRDNDIIWALKDVTFTVPQGQALGIIGRNGAGKSTLLKILSRVTTPSSGEVKVKGRIASLLEVGTGFHPELTGRENIYLNGAIMGMSRAEVSRKFDEIVDFSGVEQFIDTPVKRYSSGMYVRLAFAVAAHLDPEILIVDEVLAVGDYEFQKKCLGKMGDVAHEGRTVLFVSHNMNAIEQLCSHCLLLQSGQIKKLDKNVHEVINSYLFSSIETNILTNWVNSGKEFLDQDFTPISFSITDSAGNLITTAVPNNVEIWVQIEAKIQHFDPALTFGYAIYNEDNLLLYWSYQTDTTEKKWVELHSGSWCFKSRLPERVFNEGTFRIELISSLHFRRWIQEPGTDVPTLFFTIRGGLSDSPLWLAKRPGILAPVIHWDGIEITK
jgi:lipopolysaccharide transport system ATP-binding protein